MAKVGRGRRAQVQLRRLTRGEQRVLRRKVGELRLPARFHRRYQIVAAARGAPSVPGVARQVGCDITTAYHWVTRFNASGFTTFERPTNPRGRIPLITSDQLRELMEVALSSPRERGLPYAIWTVPTLAAYCRQRQLIPPYCDEWVRRLLRGAGMRAQRIRTWKTSTDPAFDRKKKRSAGSTRTGRRARG